MPRAITIIFLSTRAPCRREHVGGPFSFTRVRITDRGRDREQEKPRRHGSMMDPSSSSIPNRGRSRQNHRRDIDRVADSPNWFSSGPSLNPSLPYVILSSVTIILSDCSRKPTRVLFNSASPSVTENRSPGNWQRALARHVRVRGSRVLAKSY